MKTKIPNQIKINKFELLASICKQSFFEFTQEFWDTIIPEKPIWNWHIEYLCNELQIIAERIFKNEPKEYDLVINISPGSTKSTICSIMLPAWVWTRMASARIIGGSYTHLLAMDLSRRNKDVVMSEKYQKLFPDVVIREDQRAKSYFINESGGSRFSVGVGGSVTGLHGHFIIIDDPLNPTEAVSEVELKNVNRWMTETITQRKIDKAITPMILIMQRLHQDDPTAVMLEKFENVKHICLPAELSENIKPKELEIYYVDGLMDPTRLPKKILQEHYKVLGQYAFSGQYAQAPSPPGGGMIKASMITIELYAPTKIIKIIRYWDKAGTQDGGAYTAGVKMAVDREDRFWILDIVRGQWGAFIREKTIKQTAAMDGKDVEIEVEQEPGSSGKESAEATIKNLAGFKVQADSPTGDKVQRADPFATQVNGGNVYMVKASWNREYTDELGNFPFSKYKDQVDASSGAFAQLTRQEKKGGGINWL